MATGSWGTPELGVTEFISRLLGKPLNAQGGSNLIGGNPQAPTGQVQGASTVSNQPIGPVRPIGPINTSQPIKTGGAAPATTIPGDANSQAMQDLLNSQKSQTEDNGQARIAAAISTFDAKKNGLLNRIPGLQTQLTQTQTGLDNDLAAYLASANSEEGKRVGDINDTITSTNEDYTRAQRQTRATAQSLAKQLRAQFASRGSLDSTQYKDMAIDQSTNIAQALGDTRREQAGKISTFSKEQQDIKDYYSQQRDQETKRITLAKEQEKTKTDQLVQQIMDDATLTDSQKIEAVLQQQDALDQRLGDLNTRQQELAQSAQTDAANLASKQQELAAKNYSSTYDQAKELNTARKNAETTLAMYADKFGTNPTPEQATQVYIDNGIDPDKAKQFATFLFTGNDPNKQNGVDQAAAAAGY